MGINQRLETQTIGTQGFYSPNHIGLSLKTLPRSPLTRKVCALCVTFKAFPRSLLSPRTMGDLLIARCFTSQTSRQVSPSDGPLLHGAGLGNPSQSQLSRHLLCEPSSHPPKLATVSLRPVHRAQAHLGGIAGWAPDCCDKARRRLFDGGL